MKRIYFNNKKTDYSILFLSRESWRKFLGNKLSFAALVYIFISILVAVFGYLITPDNTPMANSQCLEIASRPPGFSILMFKVPKTDSPVEISLPERMLFGVQSDYFYIPVQEYSFKDQMVSIVSFSGDEKSPGSVSEYPVSEDQLKERLVRKRYLLGTDQFGRDLLSRLMIGSRVSLAVGFISVLISLIIGISIGAAGGYFRGRTDRAVVWLINVTWSVPTLLLVIAITFALGKGFWQVFIAVGFTMWVEVARVTRGQILAIREKEYIEAARALGFSDLRIILRHILPNASGPIIVISAANFASAILIEAGLSFLGIGVQPPMPSWGSMIRENYAYLILDSAYLAILPGIAIMLIVLAFMIVGNGLRDALDVRTNNSLQG